MSKKLIVGFAAILLSILVLVFVFGTEMLVFAQTEDVVAPSVPGGLTATLNHPVQIQLAWSASTDNVGVAGYHIYRSGTLVATVMTNVFYDSGLPPGGYAYTVAAYDAAGNTSIQSQPLNVNIVLDSTPPSQPTGFSAVPVSTTTASLVQVNLSWNAATDNIGVVGYSVLRDGVSLATSTPITLTSYADWVPAGTYNYAVRAYDAVGNFSNQTPQLTVTIFSDSLAPSQPSGIAAVATSSGKIYVSWAGSTDNVGVVGYYVYRDGTQVANVSSSPCLDSGVAQGNHSYTVAAYDVAGNVSAQSYSINVNAVSDNLPPSIPTIYLAVASSSQVRIYWTASYDNLAVVGYYVYRGETQIASVSGTYYTDSSPSFGVYSYSVAAYDASGNVSDKSPAVSATVLNTTPPSVPTALYAVATSSSAVYVSWGASSGTVAAAGYRIYRNGTWISDVVSSTSYMDLNLPPGSYAYTVAAYDAAGNVSARSYPANVTLGQSGALPAQLPLALAQQAGGNYVFTTYLYFGVRSNQVKNLQSLLIEQGYLAPGNATGFYGSLTLQAVKKFQCDYGIVCSGGAASTGWGAVGIRTRGILNGLYNNASSTQSVQLLNDQIKSLQAQLLNLQLQLQSLEKRAVE